MLDVRPGTLFDDGHAADSLNIGIASLSFSVWCGFFVKPDVPIALVVEDESQAQRAQLELARIGFDQVVGFITANNLVQTQQIAKIGARDLLASIDSLLPRSSWMCDQRRNGGKTIWRARFIFRCRSCLAISEDFRERPL